MSNKLTWLQAIKLYPKEVVEPEDNEAPVDISEYQTQDIDEIDTGFGVIYIGQVTKEGKYLIKRLTKNSEIEDDYTITFANYSNNKDYIEYSDAWSNRYLLQYSSFESLNNIYI